MSSIVLLALAIFGNVWIWKIVRLNPLIFLTLIFITILLWFFVNKNFDRKKRVLSVMLFVVLIILQWKTTTPQSLTILDNDEQRIKQERLQFYNPSSHYLRIAFARLNLKEFFEGDYNTILIRIQRNFYETLDPNVYFFGGHPRERVWANDFEKFHFIFIAPFFIGLYYMIKRKALFLLGYFLISVSLLTIIGHKNLLGPFILFPLFSICIYYGLTKVRHEN